MKRFKILQAIFQGCEGFLELRMIKKSALKRAFLPLESLEEIGAQQFLELNQDGWNIYFGIGPRNNNKSGTKKDVSHVPCLWADIDAKDHDNSMERAYQKATSLPVELSPSIIVNSGNGYHLYWMLKQPFKIIDSAQIEYIEELNEKLAQFVGGDSVKDISRILRLPETDNTKNPKDIKPCEIILFEPEKRYETRQFDNLAPPIEEIKAEDQPTREERWISKALWGVAEGKRHQTGVRLAGYFKNILPKDITTTILATWGYRCSPPVEKSEIERIVDDVYRMASPKDTKSAKIERIRVVKTTPPYYVIYTDRNDKFTISNEEITSYSLFSKAFFANTFTFPAWTNSKKWGQDLTLLMEQAEIEDAPDEAGKDQMLFEILYYRLAVEADEAQNTAAFRVGKVIRRNGAYFFFAQPMLEYLKDKTRSNFQFSPDALFRIVKERGGDCRTIAINQERIKAWFLPADIEVTPKSLESYAEVT